MVRRYSIVTPESCLEVSMFGDFIKYADYAALEAERNGLRVENERLLKAIQNAPHGPTHTCTTHTARDGHIVERCYCWKRKAMLAAREAVTEG